MRRALVAIAVAGLAAAAPPAGAATTATSSPADTITRVETVPPVRGVRVELGGRTFTSGRDGVVAIPTPLLRRPLHGGDPAAANAFPRSTVVRGVRLPRGGVARFDRFYDGRIAMAEYHRFRPRFTGIGGRAVDPAQIEGYRLKSRLGLILDVEGTRAVTLKSTRVVRYSRVLLSKPIEWSIESVTVDGANVVQRARVRFIPRRLDGPLTVPLLFYSLRITSRDALFGSAAGREVILTLPSGRERRLGLDENGALTLPALPRGDYRLRPAASGLTPERPVALSRDQIVELKVVSWLDLAAVCLGLGSIGLALVLVRRPHIWRAPPGRGDAGAVPEPLRPVAAPRGDA
jgi:hypothetical protein